MINMRHGKSFPRDAPLMIIELQKRAFTPEELGTRRQDLRRALPRRERRSDGRYRQPFRQGPRVPRVREALRAPQEKRR